jgi:hypothetical protein
MLIDSCSRNFETLAAETLPEYMRLMKQAMKDPWPMVEFAREGVGQKALLKKAGRSAPFEGC